MGYKVVEGLLLHPSSEANCTVYDVYENRIETKERIFIKRFMNRDDAKNFSKHLNLGGGFDGWTPGFFLKEVNI